jgi:RNA-binding protein 25
MREYAREMNFKALEAKEQAMREAQAATMSTSPIPSNTTNNSTPDISSTDSTSQITRRTDPAAAAGLDDEEGKRNLISNQIQLFRDRFKDEDTKMRNTEKERKERYERERVLQREKRSAEEAAKNKPAVSPSSHDRSSPRREHSSSTSRRDRSSPHDDRYRSSSSRNNTSNSVRSRTNDRRSPPSSRYDRRKSPVSKPSATNEDDEDAYERKKDERRLREKEIRYREVN